MIKTIEINNFLSHKETTLELSPGVNCIIGATDSGKSAIIKALKWLITNKPVGDSFRSTWGGDTHVGIGLEYEGEYICRIKGKENQYKIERKNLDQGDDVFNAIGTKVPEEIIQVLNLNEVNLQTQFESHFLLSKSPGEVATHFNKVAHLDKIDVGLKTIQSWLAGIKRMIEIEERKQTQLEEELGKFDDIEALEEKISKLERNSIKQAKFTKKVLKGEKLIKSLNGVRSKMKETSLIIEGEKLVGTILMYWGDIEIIKNWRDELEDRIRMIENTVHWEEKQKDIISLDKSVQLLLKLNKEIATKISDGGKLEAAVFQLELIGVEMVTITDELTKLEKQFHKHMGKGKICPLCGTIIK